MTTAAYLDKMLDPVSRCFTPEVADRLVHIEPDPELQARIDIQPPNFRPKSNT